VALSAYFMLPIALMVALRRYATRSGGRRTAAIRGARWEGARAAFLDGRFGLRAVLSVALV